MNDDLKKILENIMKYHKKGNGHINWDSLPNDVKLNANITQLDVIRRYCIKREFIEQMGYSERNTAMLPDGWEFESFEKEEAEAKRKNEIEKLSNDKLRVDYDNAKRVYDTYKTTRLLAWIGAISGIAALLLKIAESIGILPK